MQAPGTSVAVLQIGLTFFFTLFAFNLPLSAQTGIDDIHVSTRAGVPALRSGVDSVHEINEAMMHVIKTDTRLVLVPVTVTDGMQRFVTGLQRENFEVFEDKKSQPIQNFSSEEVRVAIHQFCYAANPQDEFFLITFSNEPRLVTGFTSSDDIAKEVLFTQAKGRTSLLDAIYLGLRKMKDAKYGKKALLIISDGGDNHSRYSEREVRGIAKESDVMIYSIGTFDHYVPTIEESRGPELLSEISEPTGGQAYMLDNASQMPSVARHIGLELRSQYVLAYRPQAPVRSGKWRKIRVTLRLPKKLSFLQAHAKTGYYASE